MPQLSLKTEKAEDLKSLVALAQARDLSQVINEAAAFLRVIAEGIGVGKSYGVTNGRNLKAVACDFFTALRDAVAWDTGLEILEAEEIGEGEISPDEIQVPVTAQTSAIFSHYAEQLNTDRFQIINMAITLYADAIHKYRLGYSPVLIVEQESHGNEVNASVQYVLPPALKRIGESQSKNRGLN